jgi:hypothetical protein
MKPGDKVRVKLPMSRFDEVVGRISMVGAGLAFPYVVEFRDRWRACFAEKELQVVAEEKQQDLFPKANP